MNLTAAAASAGGASGRHGPHLPEGQAQRRGTRGRERQSAHGRRQRRAGQRGGAEDGRERLVAEPGRDRDIAEAEVRQFQHQPPHAGAAAVVGQGQGGQRQTAIGSRLGLDGVKVDERSRGPRPEGGHRRRHVGLLRCGEHGRHREVEDQRGGDDSHTKVPTTGAAARGETCNERHSAIQATGPDTVRGFVQGSYIVSVIDAVAISGKGGSSHTIAGSAATFNAFNLAQSFNFSPRDRYRNIRRPRFALMLTTAARRGIARCCSPTSSRRWP